MVRTLPSNARGAGVIPGWGAEIPHASWPKNQNIKQKQYCNKFNRDSKKWSTSKKIFKKKGAKDNINEISMIRVQIKS